MNWARLVGGCAVFALVVAIVGFVVTLVLNLFVLDRYSAYGEIPIPGSGRVQLPAGEVTITFHTRVIGSPSGGGLPLPELRLGITAPEGASTPTVTEDSGVTKTFNNDSRRRMGYLTVPVTGTYLIEVDGQVGGFITPRLAFGSVSSDERLWWVFGAMFGGALVILIAVRRWSSGGHRTTVAPAPSTTPAAPTTPVATTTPAAAYAPSAEGIVLEQLKTIAALRDTGALTEAEFVAEKRRILGGR